MESTTPRAILTHSGRFHLDEVMATAMLDLLGLWNGHLTRTRDSSYINEFMGRCFIIDVGGVYDHEKFMYDHHQKGFSEFYNERAKELGIKMSSFGLIYKHYAQKMFEMTCDNPNLEGFSIDGENFIKNLCEKFYNSHVMEIDANDNGVSELNDGLKRKDVFKYKKNWNLISIIRRSNNTKIADTGPLADAQDTEFREQVQLCKKILGRAALDLVVKEAEYYKAREILQNRASSKIVSGKMILILPEIFNYEKAMRDLIKECNIKYEWVFTVLPRETGKYGEYADKWQVHTVPILGEQFKHVMDIARMDDIHCDIQRGIEFIHANRFIGITEGKEFAILLAECSINKHQTSRAKKRLTGLLTCGLVAILSWAVFTYYQ